MSPLLSSSLPHVLKTPLLGTDPGPHGAPVALEAHDVLLLVARVLRGGLRAVAELHLPVDQRAREAEEPRGAPEPLLSRISTSNGDEGRKRAKKHLKTMQKRGETLGFSQIPSCFPCVLLLTWCKAHLEAILSNGTLKLLADGQEKLHLSSGAHDKLIELPLGGRFKGILLQAMPVATLKAWALK